MRILDGTHWLTPRHVIVISGHLTLNVNLCKSSCRGRSLSSVVVGTKSYSNYLNFRFTIRLFIRNYFHLPAQECQTFPSPITILLILGHRMAKNLRSLHWKRTLPNRVVKPNKQQPQQTTFIIIIHTTRSESDDDIIMCTFSCIAKVNRESILHYRAIIVVVMMESSSLSAPSIDWQYLKSVGGFEWVDWLWPTEQGHWGASYHASLIIFICGWCKHNQRGKERKERCCATITLMAHNLQLSKADTLIQSYVIE